MNDNQEFKNEIPEVEAAKINASAITKSIIWTALITILGSAIIGIILGVLTIKAYTNSEKLHSKSQEALTEQMIAAQTQLAEKQIAAQLRLAEKNLDAQAQLAEKNNSTQLTIAIKSIENNSQIATKTIKNTLEAIERDNQLQFRNKEKFQKIELEAKKSIALNYYYSDISLRLIYLDKWLTESFNHQRSLLEIIDNQTGWGGILGALTIDSVLFNVNNFSWERSEKIEDNFDYINTGLQLQILNFYTSIDSLKTHFSKNEWYNDISRSAKKQIANKAPEELKQTQVIAFKEIFFNHLSACQKQVQATIQNGLLGTMDLEKKLGVKNEITAEMYKRYTM